MKLIVGLGNPGERYESTRHNLGFMVVDELVRHVELPPFEESSQAKALISKGLVGEKDVVVTKPLTFMNLSGQAVNALAHFYKVASDDIWVIHDELDLAFGTLRTQVGGGTAGHNGIKSISEELGTSEFARFRLGIANPTLHNPLPADAFVLQTFNDDEELQLSRIVDQATTTVLEALREGLHPGRHDLLT